jgi:hypothetical protein
MRRTILRSARADADPIRGTGRRWRNWWAFRRMLTGSTSEMAMFRQLHRNPLVFRCPLLVQVFGGRSSGMLKLDHSAPYSDRKSLRAIASTELFHDVLYVRLNRFH